MIQLGCIADDFTGATDLANNLVRAGFRVVQCIGVPVKSSAIQPSWIMSGQERRQVPSADPKNVIIVNLTSNAKTAIPRWPK